MKMSMDKTLNYTSYQLSFLILLLVIGEIAGCDYIHLTATTYQQSFVSHIDYGSRNYPSNYERCWLIETPPGYTLKIWTDWDFELESSISCQFDSLTIECGEHGNLGHINEYCSPSARLVLGVYSGAQFSSIKFRTDDLAEYNGFRLYYQAVLETGRDDCIRTTPNYVSTTYGSNDESDIDSSESDETDDADPIFGFIVGLIFLGIVVIVVIIAMIVCCSCCGVAASRAARARPNNYVTTHPVQYGHNMHGQAGVTVGSPVVTVVNPSLTPSQQYLPTVAQAPPYQAPVAPPAQAPAGPHAQGNIEGRVPAAFGTAPPAYENLSFSDKTHPAT